MVLFRAMSLIKGSYGSASLGLNTSDMLIGLAHACRVHWGWSKH
jgi:hypothetical protein